MWLVCWHVSIWTTEMHKRRIVSVGRWCHPDIFLQFVCVGSPPSAVSRCCRNILHQPKPSKYVFRSYLIMKMVLCKLCWDFVFLVNMFAHRYTNYPKNLTIPEETQINLPDCKNWQPFEMMKHLNLQGISFLSLKSFWDQCHSPVLAP